VARDGGIARRPASHQYVVVLKIAPLYGVGTLPGQKFVAFETNVAQSGPVQAS
jgi:hypothetical protein